MNKKTHSYRKAISIIKFLSCIFISDYGLYKLYILSKRIFKLNFKILSINL